MPYVHWNTETDGQGVRYKYYNTMPDDAKPVIERKTLHYMTRPGDLYGQDITSYADLQAFSKRVSGAIGHEKPVLHIKETFDSAYLKPSLDPYPTYPFVDVSKGVFFPNSDYYRRSGNYRSNSRCGLYRMDYGGDGYGYVYQNFHRTFWEGGIVYSEISFSAVYWDFRNHYNERGEFIRVECRMHTYDSPHYSYASASWQPLTYQWDIDGITPDPKDLLVNARYSEPSGNWGTYQPVGKLTYAGYHVVDVKGLDPYLDARRFEEYHKKPAGLGARLAAEAISATSFNSNSIANALELFDTAKSIMDGSFITDLLKKGKIFETSKDAWLRYRYQYNTTIADFEELQRYIEDSNQTICRSGDSMESGEAHMKIILTPNTTELAKTVDALTSKGVAPNLYNLWDMVPFSFVADWFIGFGDILESVTQYGRCAAYNIKSVTTSWKWKEKFEYDGVEVELEYYERQVDPDVPPWIPTMESSGPSRSTIYKRVADAVCLFT